MYFNTIWINLFDAGLAILNLCILEIGALGDRASSISHVDFLLGQPHALSL